MVFRFARPRENFKHRPPGTLKMAALQRSRYTAVGYVSLTVAAYLPKSGSREGELCGGGGGELENCFRKDFPRSKSFNNLEAIVPTLNCSASRFQLSRGGVESFPREIESKTVLIVGPRHANISAHPGR